MPQPSGRRPFILTIVPLQPLEGSISAGRAAQIVVTDPERAVVLDPAGLRALFGLTAAEAGVAVAMLRGDPIQRVADNLGITLSTARIHLSRVHEETRTRKQAQLVRLLMDIAGFVA